MLCASTSRTFTALAKWRADFVKPLRLQRPFQVGDDVVCIFKAD